MSFCGTFSTQSISPTMAASSLSPTSLIRLASFSRNRSATYRRSPLSTFKTLSGVLNSRLPPTAAAAAEAGAASSAPPHFSDLPLDRAAHLRKDCSALEQLLNESRARTIAFYDRKALVAPLLKNQTLAEVAAAAAAAGGDGGGSSGVAALPSTFATSFNGPHAEAPDGGPPNFIPLTWHPRNSDLVESVDQNIGYIFLGLCHSSGAPVFACRLLKLTPKVEKLLEESQNVQDTTVESGQTSTNPTTSTADAPLARVALVDVRSQGQKMIGNDAAIYALASGLFSWHSNTQFCSKTGSETDPDSAGHARRPHMPTPKTASPEAKQRRPRAVYPRIDPAVIVAVTYNDWLLLGRKKTWDLGRYSLLAGFAEVGETLEDAVIREVSEESGVVVDRSTIQYHSSQPWPFPQSLMIGFLGEARHLKPKNKSDGPVAGADGDGSPLSFSALNVSGFEIFPRGSPSRNAALDVGLKAEEIDVYATPAVLVDENEIEDARWFHRDWLMEKLKLKEREREGSQEEEVNAEPEFRIPGRYALANTLITSWLLGSLHHPHHKHGNSSGDLSTRENDLSSSTSSSPWSENSLPDVQIDQGVFKYVLLRASSSTNSHSKLLVRGDCRAAYHNHILTACIKEAAAIDPQITITVLGGGRMEHYSHSSTSAIEDGDDHASGGWRSSGVTTVYGYSAAFGPAPHEITAAVMKKWDPFLDVSVSYEGY